MCIDVETAHKVIGATDGVILRDSRFARGIRHSYLNAVITGTFVARRAGT